MPLNLFKRSKADKADKEKEKREKKAAKDAKKGKNGKGKGKAEGGEENKPDVPAYHHVPTHAESDALLTCPTSWLADDFERVRESNRRRLLGDVAPASAAAVASAFHTREEYRKSLMLSPMHADNLNSTASTPMGGSSSSNSSLYHGFGKGREGGLNSSSDSSHSHHSSSPDDDDADADADGNTATRRNTTTTTTAANSRSHSSTSLRKSVRYSYGPGHLDNYPVTATTRVGASVGVISIGGAAGSSSSSSSRLPSRTSFVSTYNNNGGSNLRYSTNARSLDAELSRARDGGPATDAAAVTSANAASLGQAMANLSLTPASAGPGVGTTSSRRPVTMMTPGQYATQYSHHRYGSTSAAAAAGPAVAPEAIAPGSAFTTAGHSSRRSSSIHTHTTASHRSQRHHPHNHHHHHHLHHRRQSAITAPTAAAATATATAAAATTSPSRPPVSSRGPLASISAYIKSPRPVPGVSSSPASASSSAAAAANGAVPSPSGGIRRSWSRRGSHSNVGTVF